MTDVYIGSLEELDELLHAGVKGMKWGKRQAPDASGQTAPAGPRFSEATKAKMKTGLKVAGAVTAVGAVVAVTVLAKQGKIPMPQIKKSPAAEKGLSSIKKMLGLVKAVQNDPRTQLARNAKANYANSNGAKAMQIARARRAARKPQVEVQQPETKKPWRPTAGQVIGGIGMASRLVNRK